MSTPEAPVVLERIYPNEMNMNDHHDRDSLEIHQARYRFAADHLVGNRILDMACGCGFGTALMAARHPERVFVGVDIDPAAIDYAQRHYQAVNLSYRCADAMTFAEGCYDTIVSLETIEHLSNPRAFIANLPNLLTTGGCIIASVPVTPTCDGNPHHLHDFTRRGFLRLFKAVGFTAGEELRQVQPWVYDDAFSAAEDSTSRSQGVGNNLLAYYRKHPLALVARIYAIVRHGTCNIYLTAVFKA